MRKYMNRLTVLLATLIMVLAFTISVNAEELTATKVSYGDLEADYTGKTIILTTNDVHGAIEGYKYVAGLKTALEERGAEVVLVDCGDFTQGTTYVSESKGDSAVRLMNMAGYSYAALGNHEFDFGLAALDANVKNAEFSFLSTNYVNKTSGERIFDATALFESKDSDLKLGFVGIATPETITKSHPKNFTENTILMENNFSISQTYIDDLKTEKEADLVIVLAHLGVDDESEPYRSYDLYNANQESENKIDMIIDGHSHSEMTQGKNGEPIMSTKTKLANIGAVVIDETTEKIEGNFLIKVDDTLPVDTEVDATAKEIKSDVDAIYGEKIATSKVILNGDKSRVEKSDKVVSGLDSSVNGVRDGETNMGDLVTDAIKWYVKKEGLTLEAAPENVLVVTNGGGLRENILVGDISKNSVLTVLPFGNTITAVTIKGNKLLEALEASTYCTPDAVGGFPQVSGIKYNIDVTASWDEGDQYPDSKYHGPKTIRRVAIENINGKDFNPEATYVVLTNDFCSSGGDTYYAFKAASSQFDTGISMDFAVSQYIIEELGGEVGAPYEDPKGQGRITMMTLDEAKESATAALDAIDTSKYSGNEKAAVEKAIADAKAAIKDATKVADVFAASSAARKAIADQKTDAQKQAEAEEKAKKVTTVTVNVKTVTAKAIDSAVKKAGGSEKYVTKIVIGKKVTKISANAFKNYSKVKTLEIKSKKLKKAKVKKSLKGSKVTTIKVNVGNKKTNKKYVKNYKKIFTKKNAGKKVKVK